MVVSLTKGQSVSLDKEAGGSLRRVMMGLGWDAREKKACFGLVRTQQSVDLDASCVLFDQAGKMVDTVWYRQLKSKDGSIVHTGDNRTGAGEGDDEQIVVDLSRVPAEVKTLMFVVNSFTGETFSEIENAFCRLVNLETNEEMARYNLSCQGNHTAQVMAKVQRAGDGWEMTAIGENAHGRTFDKLLPAMQPNL
jgi:tellurium resistance protein TerZ